MFMHTILLYGTFNLILLFYKLKIKLQQGWQVTKNIIKINKKKTFVESLTPANKNQNSSIAICT